jgi:hypothetical protein
MNARKERRHDQRQPKQGANAELKTAHGLFPATALGREINDKRHHNSGREQLGWSNNRQPANCREHQANGQNDGQHALCY